jgi:hypothetical protein
MRLFLSYVAAYPYLLVLALLFVLPIGTKAQLSTSIPCGSATRVFGSQATDTNSCVESMAVLEAGTCRFSECGRAILINGTNEG